MLWKTHIRISNEILRRLDVNLPRELYSRFKEGVLAPDEWKDYPHHYGKIEEIQKNVQYARQCFLQNNHYDGFFYLGVALHYIQDAYTSVISYNSPNRQYYHHNYEQSIEDSDFVGNLENTIQYLFKGDNYQLNRFSSIAGQLSHSVEGKYDTLRIATLVGKYQSQKTGKPKVDLNLALKACLLITESVIGAKNNSQLDFSLKQSLFKHENFLVNAEMFFSQEIANTSKQVENLKREKKTESGFIVKLRNIYLGLKIKSRELQLKRKYREYAQKKHLLKVGDRYRTETNGLINPHIGWYDFSVPELELGRVQNELLISQEASETFQVSELALVELVNTGRINSYKIEQQRVFLRRELNQFFG